MNRRLVIFQWIVIGVLVAGFGVVTFIALHRADAIQKVRQDQQGDIDSLKRQLQQAKATPKISDNPLPEASSNLATPTPSATTTPTKTKTR